MVHAKTRSRQDCRAATTEWFPRSFASLRLSVTQFVLLPDEFIRRTLQCALDADESCEEDIKLTGFDFSGRHSMSCRLGFLDGAKIQVGKFSQPLLRQTSGSMLAADVRPESFKLRLNFLGGGSAPGFPRLTGVRWSARVPPFFRWQVGDWRVAVSSCGEKHKLAGGSMRDEQQSLLSANAPKRAALLHGKCPLRGGTVRRFHTTGR